MVAFVPSAIVQDVLGETRNGVSLHTLVARYTFTYIQDIAVGEDAEEVKACLPASGPKWVTTLEEAWHATAEKIMPEFVRARSAVWAPCWPRVAFGRTTLEALGLTA